MGLNTLAIIRLLSVEEKPLDFGSPVMRITGGDTVPGTDFGFGNWRPITGVYQMERPIPNGSVEGASDLRWSKRRVLGPSAVEDFDLAGGSLIDDFGQALTFADLTGLVVSSVSGSLTISRPTFGIVLWSDIGDSTTISDQGLFWWIGHRTPGIPVTPGTNDLIRITAGAAGCTYDIHILGRSVHVP